MGLSHDIDLYHREEMEWRECPTCGNQFYIHNLRKKTYCSNVCRDEY
jgi:endogenous inhibitor of DNA gyrase (YacG/DUF329 family)